MTAEIAIMNKKAIALASDSAVTIGDRNKFYNTANKLFMLSKFHPVGIMVYNNAEFMGVPWEIIIKQYRVHLKRNKFDYLYEYFDDFLDFLNNDILGLNKYENDYFTTNLISFLREVDSGIQDLYDEYIEMHNQKPDLTEISNLVKEVVNGYYISFEKNKFLNNLPNDQIDYLVNNYESIILNGIDEILFDHTNIEDEILEKLLKCCYNIFIKDINGPFYSGLVIAGYGEKDIFPSLYSGKFYGIINDHVKYILEYEKQIDPENDNCIIPFAQTEIVNTFLHGINGNYLSVLDKSFDTEIISTIASISETELNKTYKEELIKTLYDRWNKMIDNIITFSNDKYVYPILESVSVAPKDELASMAESLVNLTSFKRQVSLDEFSQTVGGPIDVAVISKGDGFIWIKRKHYFNKDLNYHFFNNYYNDCKEEWHNE